MSGLVLRRPLDRTDLCPPTSAKPRTASTASQVCANSAEAGEVQLESALMPFKLKRAVREPGIRNVDNVPGRGPRS